MYQWGIRENGTNNEVDENTIFSTASISKAVTATLIMQMADQGHLDLDQPINTYLKRWKLEENVFTRKSPVTFRNLLAHTAGTSQVGFEDYYLGDTVPSILQSLNGEIPGYSRPVHVTYIPDSDVRYSGGGYCIAQVALEDLTGKSLQDLADEQIFRPLEMTRTTFIQYGEDDFPENVAKAHNSRGEVLGIPILPQLAASGLWSNARDLAMLLIEIQKAKLGKGKVFSKKMVEEMLKGHAVFFGYDDRSLGWEIARGFGNVRWFSHGGANTGTGGHIYGTYEGGNGIVVLGNGPNQIRIPIIDQIVQQVVERRTWRVPIEAHPTYRHDKKIFGRYSTRFGFVITIREDERGLVIDTGGGWVSNLTTVDKNLFAIEDRPFQISFRPNADDIEYLCVEGNDRIEPSFAFPKISSSTLSPFDYFESNAFEEALDYFKKAADSAIKDPEVQERYMNARGYQYLRDNELKKAQEVFHIMVELYPFSANAWDSLGESYMVEDKIEQSIKYYKKSVELNPGNTNAIKMIRKLSREDK